MPSEALARLVEPVQRELQRIEAELETVDAKRADLMAERREAKAVLTAINGKPPGPKPRQRNRKTGSHTAVARRDELHQWLLDNVGTAQTFNIAELRERDGFEALGMGGTYLTSILTELHNEGRLALERIGGPGAHGKTRTFRVIGARHG